MNQQEETRYQNALKSKAALTPKQAARYYDVSVSVLEKWRKARIGPKYRLFRMGGGETNRSAGRIRYDLEELDRFMPGGAAKNLTTVQAAELLDRSGSLLEKRRRDGVGPRWVAYTTKVVRYPLEELLAFKETLTASDGL